MFESLKFQCKICGMRFNSGQRYRQHLDDHFNKHLNGSKNTKRQPGLSVAQFTQTSKTVMRGKHCSLRYHFLDNEVIPYTGESTLCLICQQRLELV